MISIKRDSDDKELLLPPDARISLQFNNPTFDTNAMQGEYVLPFNVPYKGNARAFDFIHSIWMPVRSRILSGYRLLYKGFSWLRATIDINSVTAEEASLSLRLNFSSLSCTGTKLREFDYGADIDMGIDKIAFANNIATLNYPATNFNFPPVYNEGFYGEGSDNKNPDYFNIMNNWDIAAGVYLDNNVSNKNTLVPMVYLHHIIKSGFAFDGYSVDDTVGFMADATKKNLLVYTNQSIDEKGSLTGFGMLAGTIPTWPLTTHTAAMGEHTLIFNNDSTGGCYDSLGAYNPTTGHYTIQATGQHLIKVNLNIRGFNMSSPGVYPTYKLKLYEDGVVIHTFLSNQLSQAGSLSVWNASWWFTANAADVGKDLWLTFEIVMPGGTNPSGYFRLDYSYFGVNDLPNTTGFNVFKRYWNMRDQVPDITFGQLLNAIKETYNLTYKIDRVNKIVRIHYFDELLQQPQRDFSNQATSNHEIKFDNSIVIKSFNYTFGGNDSSSADSWKEYDINKFWGEADNVDVLINNDATLLGYFAYVKCLHQIWKCNDLGSSVYKWQYYCEGYKDFVVNEKGAVEIRPQLSPLFTLHRVYYDSGTPHYQILPRIKQLGSSKEFGLGDNPYDLHLVHYLGIVSGFCDLGPIPTASSVCITTYGMDLQHNLVWNKSNLLYYWQNLVYILSFAEIFVKRFRIRFPQLLQFDISDLYFFDSELFIARNAQINIGDDIDEIEMELHRVPLIESRTE